MKVSDSVNLAKALSNFNQYRKGTVGQKSQGRGSSWKGVKYLENVDHSRVAETLLNSRNWHNRTAVSAMMEMASIVEHFLALRLTWDQRKELGRVLISSLTYSGLYYMHREPPDDSYASYRIYKTDTTREEYDYPWHSSPVPFSKWAKPYDQFGNQLLRPSHPCPSELQPDPYILPPSDDRKIPWIEAVHKLESVAYRINKELLDVALRLDEDESTRLYPFEWDEYEDRRKALDSEYIRKNIKQLSDKKLTHKINKAGKKVKFSKVDIKKDKHLANFTPEEIEIWNEHWHEHFLIEQIQQRVKQRRKQYERDRDEAIQLKDWERFYQRVSVDYRGRMYLPDFSYQGSDFCRAVIEFADGQYLDKNGYIYLLNHLANHAEKEGGFGEKGKEAFKEADRYSGIFVFPKFYIDELKKVDKPLCLYRACMEWSTVAMNRLETPETPEKGIISWLPIEIDQSASAFQHIAGMMDDDDLRERAISPESIYLGVADLLETKPVNGVEPSRGEKKKIVKTIAVAWGYGATDGTCKKRLLEYRRDVEHATPYLHELTDDEVKDLGADVIKLLETKFKTCVEYRKRIIEAVDSALNNGQTFDTMMEHKEGAITWTTPSLFIARQRIHTTKDVKVRVWTGKEDVRISAQRPSENIFSREMKTKAPPNLVHSYDASLIHGLLYAGVPKPIWDEHDVQMAIEDESYVNKYPVITVHDAFACHASNAHDLKAKVTAGMANLYAFDPMLRFLAQLEGTSYTIRDIDVDWAEHAPDAFS